MLVLLGLACTLFSFGLWPFETAALWVPFYAYLGLLGGVLCAVCRKFRMACIGFSCTGAALLMMAPHFGTPQGNESEATDFRILQANVYVPGRDPKPLLNLIKESCPDMVLLQEVDATWREYLNPLDDLYPFSHHAPRYAGGELDLAVWCVLEPESIEELHEVGIPAIKTTVRVNKRVVSILNSHTAAPFSPERARRFRSQMELLAAYVREQEPPLILAGDLNSGLWSKHYRFLLKEGCLVRAGNGTGCSGTWPSFFGPFRIALDHILVSPDLEVVRCWTGPSIGSDHRPLLADLQLR